MPYYEFECDICGFVEEKFYPIIPREIPTHIDGSCRNCGETKATFKKVLSVASFHLKGVGWAKDGYDGTIQDGSKVVDFNETP